jgi:hypothetical protein
MCMWKSLRIKVVLFLSYNSIFFRFIAQNISFSSFAEFKIYIFVPINI